MTPKTLHLTNAYHPTSGGIRTFYRALLAEANAAQRLMRLVVPSDRDWVEGVGRYGLIYHVRARRSPVIDSRYRLLLPSTYLSPRGAVARILAREQPDLVEVCDKYTLSHLAALLRRGRVTGVTRPTLVGLSCERMDDNVAAHVTGGRTGRAFARGYIRHVYGPAFDVHIANSAYTAGELREAMPERDPGFVRVCHMGVDTSAFDPARRDPAWRRAALEQAGGDADSTLLLYAGRVSREKNTGLLIDVVDALSAPLGSSGRDYRLVVAGDGPMLADLRAKAEARVPGRVHFLGVLGERDALARACASADVFVHPNPREPFGIGPLEAMASGTPVVLPAAGGVLSYAGGHNSWLASPNAVSFARAIEDAATWPDPGRLASARATALDAGWPAAAARFFALYDDLHRQAPWRVAGRTAAHGLVPSGVSR